ncbi:MAG: hypothetical protein M0Z27_07000 [Thermaerobacter sp.]|jgi:Flp pilus assembly protein CpaB|nr:hypothetical protein [Thermaerobacter sp.]MDA8145790.1 hypothetical protein [Thermaerobacter sp.]
MERVVRVVVPAVAGLLLFAFSYGRLEAQAAPARLVPVLMAAGEMQAGEPFNKAAVRVDMLPAGVRTEQVLTSAEQVRGYLASARLVPGQIIYRQDLSRSRARGGLKPGEKGVVLAANLTTSGGVNPGDRVDVIGRLGKKQPLAVLFSGLRVVRVLNSAAQRTAVPSAGPASHRAARSGSLVPGGQADQVPTFVEVACPGQWELRLALASEYGVLLELDGPGVRLPTLGA